MTQAQQQHVEEKEKYERMWKEFGDYRIHSPGEGAVKWFAEICSPLPEETLIEFGSGTGRGSLKLAREYGLDVTMLDITEASMDSEVREAVTARELAFQEVNLWTPKLDLKTGRYAKWGFCTDVMEHIPPEWSMMVINNISTMCDRAFFYICLKPDSFGAVIGKPLHLTVATFKWWLSHLEQFGEVTDARDLIINGLYVVEFNR